MKVAFVTTLSIVSSYWKQRSGIDDMYGCVLKMHILNVKRFHPDSDFYILVNDRDQTDATLYSVAAQTNSTIRVSNWDRKWLILQSSQVIECCSQSWQPLFFAPQMLKIEALNIFGYDYVVYSDMDVFIKQKLTIDFDVKDGTIIAGGDKNKPLHGGVIVIKPDKESFNRTKTALQSGFSTQHGWHTLPCKNNHPAEWKWFAAGADEGIFYASFACRGKFRHASYGDFQSMLPHDHFYGRGKPWEIEAPKQKRTKWCNTFHNFVTKHSLMCETKICQ